MGIVNKPWELYPTVWKTEASFLSYIRGGIRRHLWAKSPIKLEFVRKARSQIKNPNPKTAKRFPTVWGGICEHCGGEFALKDMEVDHKTGEFSLRCIADIQKFVEGLVLVTEEDLALLCKDCHKAKTYAERFGISHDDAVTEKKAIAIQKGDDKAWLLAKGIIPATNAKARRAQIIAVLKENP